jgi:polar amino acid transport system substrate-binding protein
LKLYRLANSIMHARTIFAAAALCLSGAAAQACTLRLAPEAWPPYIFITPQGKLSGLDYELVQAIMQEAGCALQLATELPSLRRQLLFRQGQLDLMLAASDTPERRAYARFSTAYRTETVGLFTSPDNLARFRSLASFDAIQARGVSLLAPRAGWYGAHYQQAIPGLDAAARRSTFGSFEQGVLMFKAGRGELIMGDAAAVRHEARRLGVALAALPFVPFRAPVHLMLNAASTTPLQLERINAAIAHLEQDGTLAAIRTRYGVR